MKSQAAQKTDIDIFLAQVKKYKHDINRDIKRFGRDFRAETLNKYGYRSWMAADVFFDVLERGGKRGRGSLVMAGYDMCGGRDKNMIIEAARALEMLHAYLLIMDDIQDRSDMRRGKPSAHTMLADYHQKQHFAGDKDHFGVSIALNSMGIGNHSAQEILANLDVAPELKIKALNILNHTTLITAHGQTNDIISEAADSTEEIQVDQVLEWKTAHYSFLSPLQIGMTLAGADEETVEAVQDYALNTGTAFQIVNDIFGTFGTEEDNGKSPLEDIREGKRTLLTAHAMENATGSNKNFLVQMLGNHELTMAEFDVCKDIIVKSGGLDYAQSMAEQHVEKALASLDTNKTYWGQKGTDFLSGLAKYILIRQG